jgi:hypothetical protein
MSPLARKLSLAGVSFMLSVGLFAAALFSVPWIHDTNTFFEAVLAPGIALWKFSNWICPPCAERCFLLSERQVAHHIWGLICYIAAWWAIFAALIWVAWALTARITRTRATSARAG